MSCAILLCGTGSAQNNDLDGGLQRIQSRFGGAFGDDFAYSVAILGDLNADGVPELVIGTPLSDLNGAAAGDVRVIDGATLADQYLVIGAVAGEVRGVELDAGLDVDADGTPDWIATGTGASGAAGANIGAVVVASGSDGSILYRIEGQSVNQRFGTDVALLGDLQGGPGSEFAISDENASVGGLSAAGQIYVYESTAGTPTLIGTIEGRFSSARLGRKIASAGDLDGDTVPDILASEGVTSAASVVAFSGASLQELWVFEDDDVDLGSYFRAGADFDGDGIGDVLLSATSRSTADLDYLYIVSGRTGDLLHSLEGYDGWGGFGAAAVADADLTGDGFADIVVSSPGHRLTSSSDRYGRVHVFDGRSMRRVMFHDATYAGDALGRTLLTVGDRDGDGFDEILAASEDLRFAESDPRGGFHILDRSDWIQVLPEDVNVSTGEIIAVHADFPVDLSDHEYRVLLSLRSGSAVLGGMRLPLGLDSFLIDSWFGVYPINRTRGLSGALNGGANGTGYFGLLPGIAPPGVRVYLSVVANRPGELPSLATEAASFLTF